MRKSIWSPNDIQAMTTSVYTINKWNYAHGMKVFNILNEVSDVPETPNILKSL